MNVSRTSLKIRLISGVVLLAAAPSLIFLAARHGGASPSGQAPTRFVQTSGTIADLRFSQDGRFVITTEGDEDHPLLTFRDAVTGSIAHQWVCGQGEKWVSEDGQRVVEAVHSENGPTSCTLRDAASGQVLRQWTGEMIDIRPDFTLMVTADDPRELPAPPSTPPSRRLYALPKTGRVVDVATGRILGRFPMTEDSFGVRLSRYRPVPLSARRRQTCQAAAPAGNDARPDGYAAAAVSARFAGRHTRFWDYRHRNAASLASAVGPAHQRCNRSLSSRLGF